MAASSGNFRSTSSYVNALQVPTSISTNARHLVTGQHAGIYAAVCWVRTNVDTHTTIVGVFFLLDFLSSLPVRDNIDTVGASLPLELRRDNNNGDGGKA